jgi:hypothetical protein
VGGKDGLGPTSFEDCLFELSAYHLPTRDKADVQTELRCFIQHLHNRIHIPHWFNTSYINYTPRHHLSIPLPTRRLQQSLLDSRSHTEPMYWTGMHSAFRLDGTHGERLVF